MQIKPKGQMLSCTLALLTVMGCSREESARSSSDAARESRVQDVQRASNNTPAQNKELARYMIRKDYPQWDNASQLQCLDQLWYRESRWKHQARNKRTGACGIPQSYPCNKMKAMGAEYGVNYRTNPWPQIAWGLQYIDKRYGAPCAAWRRFRSGRGY